MCEPRCSVWNEVHPETVDIWFQVQHIGTWSCLRLWMFENNTGLAGGFILETVDKWPQEQGMKGGVNRRLRTCDPNYRVWKGGQPGDGGPVTTGPVSGKWHHTGDCGLVTLGARFGREWIEDCKHVTPGTGSWGWGNSGMSGHVTPQ